MKGKLLLFVVVILLSCQKDDMVDRADNGSEKEVFDAKDFHHDRIRIKLNPEFGEMDLADPTRNALESEFPDLNDILRQYGVISVKKVFNEGGKFSERRRKAGLHLWYELIFDNDIPLTRAVTDFSVFKQIDISEPAPKYTALSGHINGRSDILNNIQTYATSLSRTEDLPFNDQLLSRQWHYNNPGTMRYSVEGADINLFEAWKSTQGHPDVIVAVIDAGVQFDHLDLAGNMWINENEVDGNNTDDDNNGYIDDIYGWNYGYGMATIVPGSHGTHVAGTIAAVNNNSFGVAGIAGGNGPGTGARIMTCQIVNRNGLVVTDCFEDAFAYAADNGAVIAQCSFNSTFLISSLQAGMDYFMEHAGTDENGVQTGPMRGGIIVASAGNEAKNAQSYPACYKGVVSVAAIGLDFKKTVYSNYGEWVSICAPGGNITGPQDTPTPAYTVRH